jgi:hypothetical protein
VVVVAGALGVEGEVVEGGEVVVGNAGVPTVVVGADVVEGSATMGAFRRVGCKEDLGPAEEPQEVSSTAVVRIATKMTGDDLDVIG